MTSRSGNGDRSLEAWRKRLRISVVLENLKLRKWGPSQKHRFEGAVLCVSNVYLNLFQQAVIIGRNRDVLNCEVAVASVKHFWGNRIYFD
jgi:hypothetical protein